MEAHWRDWGARLRGLAQGGLYYGPERETFRADMDRVREIGEELLRHAADWDPDRQRAWGAELRRISDLTLADGVQDQYDLNRCLTLREIGENMEEDLPLRAWRNGPPALRHKNQDKESRPVWPRRSSRRKTGRK